MKRVQRIGLLSLAIGLAVLAQGQRRRRQPPAPSGVPPRDYSGRSGFPGGVEAARGQAAKAALPNDFMIPEPLRPLAG